MQIIGVLALLNVLSVLRVLNALNVLHVLNASFACYTLFLVVIFSKNLCFSVFLSPLEILLSRNSDCGNEADHDDPENYPPKDAAALRRTHLAPRSRTAVRARAST